MADYREKLRSHRKTEPSADQPSSSRTKKQKSTTAEESNSNYTDNISPTDTIHNTDSINATPTHDAGSNATVATSGAISPASPKTPPRRPTSNLAELFPPSPHGKKRYESSGDRYMTFRNSGNGTPSLSPLFNSPSRGPWESSSGRNGAVPTINLLSDEEMDPMTRTRHLIYTSELANSQSNYVPRNPFLDDDDDDDDDERGPFFSPRQNREEEVLRFVTPSTSFQSSSNRGRETSTDTRYQQQRRGPYVFTLSNDTRYIQNLSPTSTPSRTNNNMDRMSASLPSPPQFESNYYNNNNNNNNNTDATNNCNQASPTSPSRSVKKRPSYSFTQPASSSSSSSSATPAMLPSFPSIPDPNSRLFSTSTFSTSFKEMITSNNSRREISTSPLKILDAPELQDDFYLNLIDWGPNGCVAVGLGSCVYIWNSRTSSVTKLVDLLQFKVCSVGWNRQIPFLAIGVNDGSTMLYDVCESKLIRTWTTHTSRVSALDWAYNVVTTGGRDHAIYHHDVRSPDPSFRKLTGHGAEVCGIKWSPDSSKLATGGNDNRLMVWNANESSALHVFKQHSAAVKAIAWNPSRRGILVSGGGTADKTIKFWNAMEGSLLRSYNTGSQVCNLAWLKSTGELVSTHGYADGAAKQCNQVYVWKPEQMRRIATLSGHTSRVLYMSVSPDERTVVTGAGDETLRFWDMRTNDTYRSNATAPAATAPAAAQEEEQNSWLLSSSSSTTVHDSELLR